MQLRHITQWQKIQIREHFKLGHEITFLVTPEQDALLMHSYYTRGEHSSTAVTLLSYSAIKDRLKLYTMLNECRAYLDELKADNTY